MKNTSRKPALFFALISATLFLGLYAKTKISATPLAPSTSHLALADSLVKPPILKLTGDFKEEERNPTLTSLKVDVSVVGHIAITTMDMTFYNENNRIMEGELSFPLGEGQSISRFALEVNGTLREAVVVDKNKAQQVYEELIRAKVDPGLVEQVQGNNYKVRIYPLPPKATKRVVIAYEQELPAYGNDRLYYLPLNYGQIINEFKIHLEVSQQKVKKNSDGISIIYEEKETKTIADLQETNFNANTFLAFVVETPILNTVYLEDVGGKKYFYAPIKINGEIRVKKLPSSIALFWDASGSGVSRDIPKEIKVLKSYFSKMSSLKLTVITFANTILAEKKFTLSSDNFYELENYLKMVDYDGATQLGTLDFNQYQADEIILVSDGLSNFGKPTLSNSKTPIITINSSQQGDFDLLKYLSQSTGGNFINLNTTQPEDAVLKLSNESLRIISINLNQYKGVDEPEQLFPTVGSILSDGFSLAGICSSKYSEVNIVYGYGNEKVGEAMIAIDPSKTAVYNGMIKRNWAQKKLQSLLLQSEKNKDDIIACAVENKVVTPFTSLLVLDRLEDYVRYNITPPNELIARYDSALSANKAQEVTDKKTQIERVIQLFNERKEWWAKDFTAARNKPVAKDSVSSGNNRNHGRNGRSDAVGSGNGRNSADSRMYELEPTGYSLTLEAPDNNQGVYKQEQSSNRVTTNLTAWEPNMPYMVELKKVTPDKRYAKYLELKRQYGTSPSFYLDVTDYLMKQNNARLALRIASNLAEMELKNYRLLRVLAHKLEQTGNIEDAIELYKQVLVLRKEEPQSYRDLGLALAKNKQPQEAIEMLYRVVVKNWDGRFPELEVMVMGEINNIIATSSQKLDLAFINPDLIMAMPMEARVILNWDADNCDIDLWVTDPRGEKCFYGYRNTTIGGRNSPDFTGGYGPEEFIIKTAMKGKYKVEINYYGTREQTILGPTTVQVEMFTNYGKPTVKVSEVTRRLKEKQETIEIGTFVVE